MSVNAHRPHLYILPEDDANRKLAIGFLLYQFLSAQNLRVLKPSGGWLKVLDQFKSRHIPEMAANPKRFMVLLIDFDNDPNRLSTAKKEIPANLADRVFILGVLSEPERLKSNLGQSYEEIGKKLAFECHENSSKVWAHPFLKHNQNEIARMQNTLAPMLFSA